LTKPISLLDEILIIIVLYKQSLIECESFKSIQLAVGQSFGATLFIYDNSPTADVIPYLNSIKIKYHHDPSNPGVSKAYNEGLKVAIELNKKWLLLADQDTEFPSSIFSDYSRAIQHHPQATIFVPSMNDSIGLLSPFRLIWGKGSRLKALDTPFQSFRNYKTINSGMLISVATFERAGGYDERFPLDYSDISFSERLSLNDPDFVLIPTKCNHHFSATSDTPDISSEIERFKSFCKAVKLFKKISNQFVSLCWIILPRALKLSFRLKTFSFIKIGLNHTFPFR
jgi:GT2 family glycosyltransferase